MNISGCSDDVRRVDLLILPARQRVEEALHRARIAPFHRRIGHARDGLVKIKRRPGYVSKMMNKHAFHSVRQPHGADRQPDARDQRRDADHVENALHHGRRKRRTAPAPASQPRVLSRNKSRPNLGLREGNADLHAHQRHDQRLVNGRANPQTIKRAIQIPPLVRRINPPHHAQQHQNQPRHPELRNAVDGHRLLPHRIVQRHQQARRHPAHQRKSRFSHFPTMPFNSSMPSINMLLPRDTINAISEQPSPIAAACPNSTRHATFPNGTSSRPQPRINRPKWIPRRMRNAGPERPRHQFPRILQRHLRRQRRKVNRFHHREAQ